MVATFGDSCYIEEIENGNLSMTKDKVGGRIEKDRIV